MPLTGEFNINRDEASRRFRTRKLAIDPKSASAKLQKDAGDSDAS
jgi:hypothetical protein